MFACLFRVLPCPEPVLAPPALLLLCLTLRRPLLRFTTTTTNNHLAASGYIAGTRSHARPASAVFCHHSFIPRKPGNPLGSRILYSPNRVSKLQTWLKPTSYLSKPTFCRYLSSSSAVAVALCSRPEAVFNLSLFPPFFLPPNRPPPTEPLLHRLPPTIMVP